MDTRDVRQLLMDLRIENSDANLIPMSSYGKYMSVTAQDLVERIYKQIAVTLCDTLIRQSRRVEQLLLNNEGFVSRWDKSAASDIIFLSQFSKAENVTSESKIYNIPYYDEQFYAVGVDSLDKITLLCRHDPVTLLKPVTPYRIYATNGNQSKNLCIFGEFDIKLDPSIEVVAYQVHIEDKSNNTMRLGSNDQ